VTPGERATRVTAPGLSILKLLAMSGGARNPVVLTSREVGEKVGLSQQAADRHLVELEKRGLLVRQLASRSQRLVLTPTAMDLLRSEYATYRRIFEGPAALRFTGTVRSGLGEGRYYLSQPGYVVQFAERLGYSPFPGTLNIGLPAESGDLIRTVRLWAGIRIDGFEASGRTFGGATCYAAHLSGRPCHVIVPDRTHHQDVVEVIAAEKLRDVLHLSDGDRVPVEIHEA
jgi:riboflavin kinase, archaea type